MWTDATRARTEGPNTSTQMSPQTIPTRKDTKGQEALLPGGSWEEGAAQMAGDTAGSALSCLPGAWLQSTERACPEVNSAEALLLSDRYSNEWMFHFKRLCLKIWSQNFLCSSCPHTHQCQYKKTRPVWNQQNQSNLTLVGCPIYALWISLLWNFPQPVSFRPVVEWIVMHPVTWILIPHSTFPCVGVVLPHRASALLSSLGLDW